MDPVADMTLRGYWAVVARHRWIVIGSALVAVVAALAVSGAQEPIYAAQTEVRVSGRATSGVFDDGSSNAQSLERAVQTEVRVIEGEDVRRLVQEGLGLDRLPQQASATSVEGTDVVLVTVRSGDPEVAARLADEYVRAYSNSRRDDAIAGLASAGAELQGKVTELQGDIDAIDAQITAAGGGGDAVASSLSAQRLTLVNQQAAFKSRLDQLQVDAALTTGGADVIRSATPPSDPVVPNAPQAALIALAIGLVIGVGAAFTADYLDDSVRTAEDLEALSDRPVLATVPVAPAPDGPPIALRAPHDPAVESYRGLRTNLQFLALDTPLRVIQVTSSVPGEGKTTTAANLAVTLADAGKRVAVIDADLRKPRLHDVFGVPPVPGLTEALLGEPIDRVVRHAGGVDVITAGSAPPNPGELIASPRFELFLRDIADRYDHVVLDSAPVLPVADSIALAAAADAVLVVAQAERTTRRTIADGLERLTRVHANVVGIVLNRARPERGPHGYGYGYGDGYRAVRSVAEEPAPEPVVPDALQHDDRTRVGGSTGAGS